MTYPSSIMECKYCEGTGITNQPNGPDDYSVVFCTCEAGEEKLDEINNREVDSFIENQR